MVSGAPCSWGAHANSPSAPPTATARLRIPICPPVARGIPHYITRLSNIVKHKPATLAAGGRGARPPPPRCPHRRMYQKVSTTSAPRFSKPRRGWASSFLLHVLTEDTYSTPP